MTKFESKLDCLIIGHNDVDFRTVEAKLKKTQHYSGAYADLKTNSVYFHGRRITYMPLLNEVMKRAVGTDPRFCLTDVPHLGAVILKSFLQRRGFNVGIVNSFNNDQGQLIDLLSQSPNAVAIMTTFYVDNDPIIEIVQFIKRHNPKVKIIVGGPHIFNLFANQERVALDFILKSIGADFYICDSQGELTLSLILGELRRGDKRDFSNIPNLTYTFDNIEFHQTNRVIENNDLSDSSADWRYFDPTYYTPTTQLRTARSCAFSCSFCKYPLMAGPLNLIDLGGIERELDYLSEAGVQNIVFIDDTFNVPLSRFKDICRLMINKRYPFNWYSFFRCSNSDDEAFDLMEKSRCKGVFLGIESGDEKILKGMNKFANIDRYKYGIRKLKERGIVTFASIIVGFPGETEQSVRNTMDFLEEASPNFYRAELYYHYSDVPIHKQSDVYGICGAGYSWKHNTMEWQRAVELVQRMYKTIRGPSVVPAYMFDFWSIPYLIGKGLSLDQITGFTRIAQEILINSLGDSAPDTSRQEDQLLNLLQIRI
jgi:radical SAM PhpK family P-methyltransferase